MSLEDTGQPPKPQAPKPKTFADLTKEQQAEIHGGEALGELIKLKQWQFYEKILKAHVETSRNALEVPMSGDGFAQALKSAEIKGTIIGLRLALAIPSVTMGAAQDLRKRLLGNEGNTP